MSAAPAEPLDTRTQFVVIPAKVYNRALLDMAINTPASAMMLHHALGDPEHVTFTCGICGRSIWFQDCPTGGWWVHDIKFPDATEHEAICSGYGSDDE